jgi:alanyl-tRNA synthetase/misacylated tRNA(Ala) deacylase
LRRDGSDATKSLRSELGKLLIASHSTQLGDKRLLWIKRDEKTTHDFEFMGTLASGVMATSEAEKNLVILVTSTLPGKDQTQLVLVQSNDQEKAKEAFEAVKAALDGEGEKRVKGGGAKGRFMGKVEGKWGKAEDLKVSQIVEKVSLVEQIG